MNTILRCLQCNELFRPTEYDSHPSFLFDEANQSFEEIEMDDWKDFMSRHKGHSIIELYIMKGPFCSHDDYWELIREDYFEATDGASVFTIKRWRADISQPFKYEIVLGRIQIGELIFQAQSVDLKKQMLADVDTLLLSEPQIDKFVKVFNQFTQTLTERDVWESSFSSDEPMTSYASLSDESIRRLLEQCKSEFMRTELHRLHEFVEENSDYDDVATLKVIRQFKVV